MQAHTSVNFMVKKKIIVIGTQGIHSFCGAENKEWNIAWFYYYFCWRVEFGKAALRHDVLPTAGQHILVGCDMYTPLGLYTKSVITKSISPCGQSESGLLRTTASWFGPSLYDSQPLLFNTGKIYNMCLPCGIMQSTISHSPCKLL